MEDESVGSVSRSIPFDLGVDFKKEFILFLFSYQDITNSTVQRQVKP